MLSFELADSSTVYEILHISKQGWGEDSNIN